MYWKYYMYIYIRMNNLNTPFYIYRSIRVQGYRELNLYSESLAWMRIQEFSHTPSLLQILNWAMHVFCTVYR